MAANSVQCAGEGGIELEVRDGHEGFGWHDLRKGPGGSCSDWREKRRVSRSLPGLSESSERLLTETSRLFRLILFTTIVPSRRYSACTSSLQLRETKMTIHVLPYRTLSNILKRGTSRLSTGRFLINSCCSGSADEGTGQEQVRGGSGGRGRVRSC